MNIVIYARYSSRSQTEQSIEGQLQICYEFAKNNGHLSAINAKSHQDKTDNRQKNTARRSMHDIPHCAPPFNSISTICFHSSRERLPVYVSPTIFPSLSTKNVSGTALTSESLPFR